MIHKTIQQSLNEANEILQEFMTGPALRAIEEAGFLLSEAFRQGNKVMSCGNGGSMCDAMHFAEELSGRFRYDRPPLPAISISDPAHITCTSNDYGFENIFSRFVEALGKEGDILLAISTSGNSDNVIKAAEAARERGMQVIALTGKDGGKLAPLATVEIRAPFSSYSDRTQEIHIKVIHILIQLIEEQLFGI
jgi:D-sedoheptulose 7-phosphate isomerase